ncbi:MAG: hypothetical protein GX248_04765 [Peptococcaceae bacterium]|jgi:uncharacterized protein (UPF0332 family)|nr:hypothetical protein [Peptococcaceae bacterium]
MGKIDTVKIDGFMQSAFKKYEIARKKFDVEDYYGVINDIHNSALDMGHALLVLHGIEVVKYTHNYEYKIVISLYNLREKKKIPKCLFCYFDAYVLWPNPGRQCYYPDHGKENAKMILERALYLWNWIEEIIKKPDIDYCSICNFLCTCKYDLFEAEDPDCKQCLNHRNIDVS